MLQKAITVSACSWPLVSGASGAPRGDMCLVAPGSGSKIFSLVSLKRKLGLAPPLPDAPPVAPRYVPASHGVPALAPAPHPPPAHRGLREGRGARRDDRRASDGPEVELGVDDAHCAPLEHDDRAALRVRVEHPERRARGDALAPPHLREAPPGHVVAEAAAAELAVGARRDGRRRLEAAEVGRAEQREHVVGQQRGGARGVDPIKHAAAPAAPPGGPRRARPGGPRGGGGPVSE